MNIPERSLEVLKAIVRDYVNTNLPVGSKSIADKHHLGVSAATVRNDMALLEEEELIIAPHTSSGRIPTDKGYRVFVEQLSELKPLSKPERQAIESFLESSLSLDETVEKSARALAQLTNALALVRYPSLGKAQVRHIELIPLSGPRTLLMLITDAGRVQQQVVEFENEPSEELLQDLRGRLNGHMAGRPLADVATRAGQIESELSPDAKAFSSQVITTLAELVDENRQEKVIISGTANLVRTEQDFSGGFSEILDLLEEQVVLLRLVDEVVLDVDGIGIKIGTENQLESLNRATMMIGEYGSTPSSTARVGVLGPTRMDYSGNIASLRAVARYLTKSLDGK